MPRRHDLTAHGEALCIAQNAGLGGICRVFRLEAGLRSSLVSTDVRVQTTKYAASQRIRVGQSCARSSRMSSKFRAASRATGAGTR